MLEKIISIQNIGQFENCGAAPSNSLDRVAVIFAENGRGKTTLASILRSLATNDPEIIRERKRLGNTNQIKVALKASGNTYIFNENRWVSHFPNIKIFDDYFIQQNVFSGLSIDSEQRQNLHELILGSKGISLNSELQQCVREIEEHNKRLREKESPIAAAQRGQLTVDAFCDLIELTDVDNQIQQVERKIAACNSAEEIKAKQILLPLSLPNIDVNKISKILETDLNGIQSATTNIVQSHFESLGKDGEKWVAEGLSISAAMPKSETHQCPFCSQDLSKSSLFAMYEHYFSESYRVLKDSANSALQELLSTHGSAGITHFERQLLLNTQLLEFWKRFSDFPALNIAIDELSGTWKNLSNLLANVLQEKIRSPLEKFNLSQEIYSLHTAYIAHQKLVATASSTLLELNEKINLIKEGARTENLSALTLDLANLKANKLRFTEPTNGFCIAYKSEKAAKKLTEEKRDKTRQSLEEYRSEIFQKYEVSINSHLASLNAAFRLSSVTSVNNRGGSSCNYSVLVNNEPVSITADSGPSFKNTLSAGDRNTLALAFFFSSIDHDDNVDEKIMVIDDPMTSLDEHRILATIQHIKLLSTKVKQTILLSHSKQFLFQFWELTKDLKTKSSLKIFREGQSSSIADWDIAQDSVTDHDRRYQLISDFLSKGHSKNDYEVASALRPTIEAFLRVAYPNHFKPGDMLGKFLQKCENPNQEPEAILSSADLLELRRLLGYSNLFHHDTNPGYLTQQLNEQELHNFAKRTLSFIRK